MMVSYAAARQEVSSGQSQSESITYLMQSVSAVNQNIRTVDIILVIESLAAHILRRRK